MRKVLYRGSGKIAQQERTITQTKLFEPYAEVGVDANVAEVDVAVETGEEAAAELDNIGTVTTATPDSCGFVTAAEHDSGGTGTETKLVGGGTVTADTPDDGTELQQFAQSWGLDYDCIAALGLLPEEMQHQVISRFVPRADTYDVKFLFMGFLRSMRTPRIGWSNGKEHCTTSHSLPVGATPLMAASDSRRSILMDRITAEREDTRRGRTAEICYFHRQGKCKRGNRCHFYHD